jgi:hypothetical protein
MAREGKGVAGGSVERCEREKVEKERNGEQLKNVEGRRKENKIAWRPTFFGQPRPITRP